MMMQACQANEALHNMLMVSLVLISYALGDQMFESLKVMLDQELDSSFFQVTWFGEGDQKFVILLEPWTESRFAPWGDGDQNFWIHSDV